MAMVSVVNWQPTGGLMAQVDRLGPKVGGQLAPCCIHHVNQRELSQCFKLDDSTIKIILVLLLFTASPRRPSSRAVEVAFKKNLGFIRI